MQVKELNAGRLRGTMNVCVRTRKGQTRLEMEGNGSLCYPVLVPVDRVSETCAEYRRGTTVARG